MTWIITEDHIDDDNRSVGRGQWGIEGGVEQPKPDPESLPIEFRLTDEDGLLHYVGRCDKAALARGNEGWGSGYTAWRWGMWMSGATEFEVKAEVYVAEFAFAGHEDWVHEQARDGWYGVFA